MGGPYGPGSLHFLWPELSHVAARGSVIHLCAHEEKEMGFGNIGLSFDFPSSVPQPYSACTWGRETRGGKVAQTFFSSKYIIYRKLWRLNLKVQTYAT